MTIVEIERVSAPPRLREDAREERERRAGVLEAAALEIEVRGWNDGDGSERVCVMEAMALAQGERQDQWVYTSPVWGFELFDDTLWRWNDNHCDGGQDAAFLLRWRAQEIRDGWDNTRRVAALNPSPLKLEEAK